MTLSLEHFKFGKCRRFRVNTWSLVPLPTPLWPGCTVITPRTEAKQLFPSLRSEQPEHTSSQSHCHQTPARTVTGPGCNDGDQSWPLIGQITVILSSDWLTRVSCDISAHRAKTGCSGPSHNTLHYAPRCWAVTTIRRDTAGCCRIEMGMWGKSQKLQTSHILNMRVLYKIFFHHIYDLSGIR